MFLIRGGIICNYDFQRKFILVVSRRIDVYLRIPLSEGTVSIGARHLLDELLYPVQAWVVT